MKISLIGAGSVVFAKTLIGDILQFPEFNDITICLMDINPDRLKVADIMMKKICAKLGKKARIESTLDRTEAVRGAKYVITTFQVGGYEPGTVIDFEIPKKYGLQQTIGDTLGIGGIFRGLRTIPELLKVARDIADHAHPDCMLLNYSNPMAMNCWAVANGVGIPHVGLCHSVFGTARMLASHAEIPFDEVSYQVAGINHMAFFLKFQLNGQDAYPLLFKVLEKEGRDFEKVRYEIMRRTGYFVTESSEHQSEYVPYFIHHGQEIIDQFDIPIDEYLRRCKAIISTWEESEKQLLADNGEIEINQQSHEYGSYIIHSLETNTLRTVYGNVPNHGIIENLPDPCCVEVPCQVDATGLSPVKIGSLPPQLAAMCMSNINVQELTVQAALTGKREHIYHAAMIDPHTAATLTLDKIWALCDELIEAHQNHGFLGEYSPVVKNTGRSAAEIGKKQIIRLIDFGFKNKQGEQTDLEFKVEGDLREFFPEDKLFISTDSKEITLSRDTISLQQLKNGDRITAVANSNIDQPIKIKIRSEHSEVLCVGTTLQPRTKIQGSLGKNPEFKLDLSGFECAHGELSRSENALTISMKVNDSNIKEAAKDSPWQGSCIEFYFSSTYNLNSIKKITIQPSEEGDFTAFEQIRTISNKVKIESIKRTKMYYCCDIIIPLECLDMNITEDSLLMNCAVRVNALGDAHSGGRNSLDGNVSANQITGNFIQVCF